MKKIGLIIFITALVIGSISAMVSTFGNFSFNFWSGIKGSGVAKTETRDAAGFKQVKAGGAMSVDVTAGKDFNITVEADDNLLQYISTKVEDDVLQIRTEKSISPKTKIKITVTMPELTGMDISGASSGTAANVKTDSLDLHASGASKIKIDGEASNLKANASGASTIDAENVKAGNADADASGASRVIVSPANDLKAEASGASSVLYTGEPKTVKQDASGASSVKRK
jgi:Putative auto-transporter adhesin, head GIN domain